MKLELTKEQLDYLIEMIEKDIYEHEDMDIIHDLYSKLVVKCSKFSAEEIAEEKIFNKSFEIKDEDKLEKYCPKCGRKLEIEQEKEIDYPYICKGCDENFYEFEVKNK